MTPAEAREIDRQEFAAECAAIRQRAYAYVERRRYEARAQITCWLGRTALAPAFKPVFNRAASSCRDRKKRVYNPPTYTVNGVTLTRAQWAERLGITKNALQLRIHRTGSLEAAVAAIAMGRTQRCTPGVVTDLAAINGTGARSTLHPLTNITFAEKTDIE